MTAAVLDDHLLRDLLSDRAGGALRATLGDDRPATTNLYYVRLCRSVVAARGGALTGGWSTEERQALGRTLVALPEAVMVPPMASLAFRMAELSAAHGLSALGAEAIAAAERLVVPLCVWDGDDGPRIRNAASTLGIDYRLLPR